MRIKMNIKKLTPDARIPTYANPFAAGCDLYSAVNTVVNPGATVKVNTGIAVEIPDGYFGGVFARSGLSTNQGLRPANCVGVIDSDYRGELIVAVHNDSSEKRVISKGDRIAQFVIMPYLGVEFTEVDELEATERSTGGFGSTGK